MNTQVIFLALLVPVFAASASAQWPDRGRLNAWSSLPVSRTLTFEDNVYLADVRVAKNKGFDRLVFEFTGGLPRYSVGYATKLEMDGEDIKPVKVKGKSVVSINLQSLPYPEDPNYKDVVLPSKKPGLRSFAEIQETEWFEGVRFYLVRLESRSEFRVLELSDPYRLVIDFRH